MPLPAEWTTVPVVWTLHSNDSVTLNGTVWFTAEQVIRVSGTTYLPAPIVRRIRNGVMDPLELLATDDPDATPGGWVWRAKVVFDNFNGLQLDPFTFSVPAVAAQVNLANVVPTTPSVASPMDVVALREELLAIIATSTIPWTNITDKPLTFTPSLHVHAVGDITGLGATLDAKAALAHTHAVADVVGLQAALDDPVDWTEVQNKPATFPASVHTHDDRYYTEAEVDALVNPIAEDVVPDFPQYPGTTFYTAEPNNHVTTDLTNMQAIWLMKPVKIDRVIYNIYTSTDQTLAVKLALYEQTDVNSWNKLFDMGTALPVPGDMIFSGSWVLPAGLTWLALSYPGGNSATLRAATTNLIPREVITLPAYRIEGTGVLSQPQVINESNRFFVGGATQLRIGFRRRA